MIATLKLLASALPPVLEAQGLTLRNWREDGDFERMAVVLNASRGADGLEEARTGDDLRLMYADLKNFDAANDLLLIERDAELVGYADGRWTESTDESFVYFQWIFVLPEWRGRGVEDELLRATKERQRSYAMQNPQHFTHWYELSVADSQTWLQTLVQKNEYQPVRYLADMVCSNLDNIPNLELPPGIETRLVHREQWRAIWDADGEAFSEHWGRVVEDESDYQRFANNPRWNSDLWQVAWEGDQIVGMVLNYVEALENEKYNYKRGYTENIGVRKPWRGRGIAQALLVKSMKMFREMGFDHTALGVDTENATGAFHLYEKVGYRQVRSTAVFRKQINL
ncbi:MAG: GNAT family N-acetyltransferase [Anaerolineae bacterium]|nr:GNAT family N-acetyltransferase [Anaerolineae bacterium]